MQVPFFRPSISEAAVDGVSTSLRSGWLTTGPRVEEFETEFGRAVGAEYAIAVNSCTAALHLALVASGIGPGDEVLVPTMTFAATAEVVLAVGAVPVLVDCDPNTLAIDLDQASSLIGPNTRALIPMHYGGTACDMSYMLKLKDEHDLIIVEDAAHAFPARSDLGPIGSLGDATCFSFYANKTITTGEGGMLTTNDHALAQRVRLLSLHGLSRDAWSRFETSASWDYDIECPGWKYNMTDLAGALGVSQLATAEDFAERRREIHRQYDAEFAQNPRLRPRVAGHLEDSAAHLYVLRFEGDRNRLISALVEDGIGTSVHYRPLHMHSYYREVFGARDDDLPVAAEQFKQIISLPLYPSMTDLEVEYVIEKVLLRSDSVQC